jgi:RHS repeat-associated protein
MGNITAIGNAPGANPATETYSYDPLYRLTQITEADGSTLESVTYNPTGDRLSKTGSGLATGNYSYNPNTHQLIATGNAARSVDANGNTTAVSQAGSVYGFGYSDRNRMTVAQLAGSTVGSYTYNVLNQRVQKIANGGTQRFNYDEASQMLAEYGATNRDYIWMDGIPVANVDMSGTTSTIAYVTADQLGTPRAVVDGSGNALWAWTYQGNAWGEQQPTSNGYSYNLRFPGQYFDAETGLHQNVNRDYDPATGTYRQVDPIGYRSEQSSLYAYVAGNPISAVDPLGLCDQDKCKQLEEKIRKLRDELAKRYSDLRLDELGLPPDGPMSIGGHQQQFQNKQTQLRRLLNDYDSQGCSGGLPGDAWGWATKPTPSPAQDSQNFAPNSEGAAKAAVTAGALAAILAALGLLAN